MNEAVPLSPTGVKLSEAVRRAAVIERRLDELAEEAETLADEHRVLVRRTLPDLLAEAGSAIWETEDAKVKIAGKVGGTFKNSTDPEAGITYLRTLNAGLPIKTVLSVEFSESERAICAALAAQIKIALDKDAPFARVIHPQTLAAWARERLSNGEPVDLPLIGLTTWREAVLTLKSKEQETSVPIYETDPATGALIQQGISQTPEDRKDPAANGEAATMPVDIAALEAMLAAAKAQAAAAQPAEPAKAPEPAEPAEPAKPAEPAEPAKPAKAARPKAETVEAKVARLTAEAQAAQKALDAASLGGGAADVAEPNAAQRAAQGDLTAYDAPGVPGEYVEGPLDKLFDRDREKGVDFDSKDIAVPRLYLLQDGSPQVKDRSPDYIPGARPGMWFNTVTGAVVSEVLIVPVKFHRRYPAWRPRAENGSGGGLLRLDVGEAEYEGYEETAIGVHSYRDDKGPIEVVETPEWIALLLGAAGTPPMPVAISFPKTKAKVAAQMNAQISLQLVTRRDGTQYCPPAFANVFRLGSKVEGEGTQSYFVPLASLIARVTRVDIYERAEKLFRQFDAGHVTVVEASTNEQG